MTLRCSHVTSSNYCSEKQVFSPELSEGDGSDTLEPFRFSRDTFTFVNELVWRYRFDPVTGAMTVCPCDPPPSYSHRCFVVVRSARQFKYHARFVPELPRASEGDYVSLIRRVVSSDPRKPSTGDDRVALPGFVGLREFSGAYEHLLKRHCGGPLQSYFIRSHWRMVFPVPGWHQREMAERLLARVRAGAMPLVHVFKFPRVTINHGLLLFGAKERETEIEFMAYDPNIASEPVTLKYDRDRQAFVFPATIYWSGGPVKVIEIFRGGLY